MKTLALETATAQGSIALFDGGMVSFESAFPADRKHSGAFFENVQRCLERYGPPEQVVVGIGPGSYAGVRIAIACAIGLGIATGARIAGIPSICALDVEQDNYCVIGDARRDSFFYARIEQRRLIEEPILLSQSELEARLSSKLLPVYASEKLGKFPAVTLAYPSAGRLAKIAVDEGSEIAGVEVLEPIYLRPPHITTPKSR